LQICSGGLSRFTSFHEGLTFAGVLKRRVGENGAVFYMAPGLEAIGVPHAFSTRLGGVSAAPFESLNLGNPSGCDVQDDAERIETNYARLMSDAGCPRGEWLRVHQVHGNEIACVEESKPFDSCRKADALVSRDRRRTISVRIADCVPVLVASQDGKVVAAVHAGWRGIISGVIPATLKRLNSDMPLVAAIGPSIGPEAFQVGPEVLGEFTRVFGSAAPFTRNPDGTGQVDLRRAAKIQLMAGGVGEDRIDSTDLCTFGRPDEFFSHRRDRGVTGRMAALIAPAA
jgi:YfiH family protein